MSVICSGTLNADDFSHSLKGGLEFCLPVGVILLGFYYGLRLPVVEMLPARQQKYFLPFCRRPIGSPWIVLVSLMVGICIHLLLDSFTHKNGWFVENLPLLQTAIFTIGTHTFRILQSALVCLVVRGNRLAFSGMGAVAESFNGNNP